MKRIIYISCVCFLIYSNGYGKEYIQKPVVLTENEKQAEFNEIPVKEDNRINIYLKAGTDFNRKFEIVKQDNISLNKKKADNFSWELALEGTKEIYKNTELGIGVAYQAHGKPKSADNIFDINDSLGYSSVPLYLTGKYNFNSMSGITPFVKMNFGYSYNTGNHDTEVFDSNSGISDIKIKHGLYYGAGIGAEYNNFIAELMYQVNKAEAEISYKNTDNTKNNFDYDRITFSFGYKF